jgi:hypothetical protein
MHTAIFSGRNAIFSELPLKPRAGMLIFPTRNLFQDLNPEYFGATY